MTLSNRRPSGLALLRAITVALIAFSAWRLVAILPAWAQGVPPQYAGQYEGRLLFAAGNISLLSGLLVTLTAFGKSARGRITSYTLLAFSAGVLAIQIYSGL